MKIEACSPCSRAAPSIEKRVLYRRVGVSLLVMSRFCRNLLGLGLFCAISLCGCGASKPPHFLHTGITTTVFWVGEDESDDNDGVSNARSAWDEHWLRHFGGVDQPDRRQDYFPADFIPRE